MVQLRFVTLTLPPTNLTSFRSLRLLLAVWEKFRKPPFFINYISGFARDAEFTVRADGTSHPHIHAIFAGTYLPGDECKAQWTKCAEKVYKKAGQKFEPKTDSGQCVVHFKQVLSVESGTRELCKYITKSDSWSEVPKEHLLEMALVARWPKMFALGGTFALAAARLERQRTEARAAAISTTTAGSAATGYLDTKSLSGSFALDELSGEAKEIPKAALLKRKKKPNWRTLVREIGLERYKIVHAAQVAKQRSYRKRQLIEKYPLATFKSLNGRVWYSPQLEFVEEYSETTGETFVWNTPPKPQPVEILDFDEERARAEYPAEFGW